MKEIDPRLTKLIALAREGVGGEKENAIAHVKRICLKEGLDFHEVMTATEEREYVLYGRWRSKDEKNVVAQVCFRFAVPDGGKLCYNDVRKIFIYNTTPGRHIETVNAAAIYLAAYRKERKRMLYDLFIAYARKHRLYRAATDDSSTGGPIDYAAELRRAKLQEGLDDVTVHKALNQEN